MRGKPIYLDANDDEPEYALTTPDPTTGDPIPATGIANLVFRLSATRDGAAIGSLSVPAVERTGLGRYYGLFAGAALAAQLVPYTGKDVYQTFTDGVHVTYTVARRVTAVRP